MAALIPMRYCPRAGEAPAAIASNAASSARPDFIESSVRRAGLGPTRFSAFKARHLGGDPLLLVTRVHRRHQGAVVFGHHPALHLSRGRHRLVLPLGIELARQEAKRLHLLDPRE